MLYPSASTWLSTAVQLNDVGAYANQVAHFPRSAKQELISKAKEYNMALPQGELRDPYAGASTTSEASSGVQEYLSELALPGRSEIGQLEIPKIDVNLPIYHGTAAKTLDKGVGHLYGSSLPVGGKGTHTVLSGHSGLPTATMFTDLNKLKIGDKFSITVLDQTINYKVDQINVVLPDDPSALKVVPGKDYVTLVTCTPIHINTHRLLVRGERIGSSSTDLSGNIKTQHDVPFPTFMLVFLCGVALVILFVYGGFDRIVNFLFRRKSASKPRKQLL